MSKHAPDSRRPRPGNGGTPNRATKTPKSYVRPDDGFFALRMHRWLQRRQARKARVAAMPLRRRVLRRSLIAGTWLLGLVAALMVTTIVLFYTLTNVPQPESLPLPQKATIEYADGSTLATIGSVDRTVVPLSEVPQHVRWSVLAAEDRSFYTEHVVSIKGTVRAALDDLKGGDTQGGSGITQQYVKNAYLSNSQTLSRKLKELMIAVKLSREYTKDQILGFYLNTVYFGRGAYGIQAAAQAFFGENAQQLTESQGALLAGMLRAPGYYDPAAHPNQARDRWNYVLQGLVTTGHLSKAKAARQVFPKTRPVRSNSPGTKGWKYLLTNEVLEQLAQQGISAKEVYSEGMTIRTTINKKAQLSAVSAVNSTFDNTTKQQRNLKTALVAINPRSGGVLAYYGGTGPGIKDLDGKVDFNDYASQGARPPGSTMKPYVLAEALTQTLKQVVGKAHYALDSEDQVTRCQLVEGTKICNDPGDDDLAGQTVTLADALKYSLNTVFDDLASQVGPSKVATLAHAMGISKSDSNGTKTLVNANGGTSFGIGIGDYPVSVLDNANGYATLADKGVQNTAYLVQTATAANGAVAYQHKSAPKRVIDKRVANDVTLAMKPIANYSGVDLADGRESAAKTGTEGVGKGDNNSDAWMAGFTPQVASVVWVGTGYNRPIFNRYGKPLYGSGLPGKTWQRFMDGYLKHKKMKSLPDTQEIGTDGKNPGAEPTQQPTYTPTTPENTPSSTQDTPSSPPPSTQTAPVTTSAPPTHTTTPPSTPPPSTPSAPASSTCGGILGTPCNPGGG